MLGREVAVKQVGLLPGESAPDLARALREARSSAGLHHPHVVAVFDAVEGEDDRIWLVMEHVPGTTLAEIVRAEGRLEPRRVAAIGAQVAGFWDTIDAVAVEGTSLGDDGVVTVQLVYDGAEQESRRLLVERGGEGWVIGDDLGPA